MKYSPLPHFTKDGTQLFKGISIILIALHNYYRWVDPITGENEFYFSVNNYLKSFLTLRTNPLEVFNVFFNFLGFYGVQGFIVISAYGLTLSYRQKRPGYGNFIGQRFNKLYPSFVFAAALLFLFTMIQEGYVASAATLKDVGLQLTLLANFVPGKAMSACGPWWFYSFIFQMYLVFPLIFRVAEKWGFRGLLGITIAGYAFTILMYPVMGKADMNPYFLFAGHLPEFCLGVYLAMSREIRIPWWLTLASLAVLIAGNIYPSAWPFANLSAAILLVSFMRWFSAVVNPGSAGARIIGFIGAVSMYLFAIQGFTRWPFVKMSNYLGSPVTALLLGLMFLAFATGIAYLMKITEDNIRVWISLAKTRGGRIGRTLSLPLLVFGAFTVIFLFSAAAASEKKIKEQQVTLPVVDSTSFEAQEKDRGERFTDRIAYTGKTSFAMPGGDSYSPRVELDFGKIDASKYDYIKASVMLYTADTSAFGHLVFEVIDKPTDVRVVWESTFVNKDRFVKKNWFPVSFSYKIPKEYKYSNYLIRVYLWNNSPGTFYADDLKVTAVTGNK